jgi:large subunit ribosomal protein L25
MKQFSLNVSPREGHGRRPSRRLRATGKIPAILYGKGIEPQQLIVDVPEFRQMLKAIAGEVALIEIKHPAGESAVTLIREVQRDAITDQFLHIDFHQVALDEPIEIRVPVHVTGESYGVKNESGVLEFVSHVVTVRALPRSMPSFIEVDVTELRVGQTIHIRELPAKDGIEYRGDPDQPIVSCVAPVAEEEPAAADAAAPVAGATPAAGAPAAAAGAAATPAPAAGAAAKTAATKK